MEGAEPPESAKASKKTNGDASRRMRRESAVITRGGGELGEGGDTYNEHARKNLKINQLLNSTRIAMNRFAFLVLVLLLVGSVSIKVDEDVPRKKIKSCSGSDLPYDAEVRVGYVGGKKGCEHYDKTKFGDYLLAKVEIKLFKDCRLIHTTERIEGDKTTEDNESLVFQLGMGKNWMKALNKGMTKMCKGEKRRITAPAKYGFGELATIEVSERYNEKS